MKKAGTTLRYDFHTLKLAKIRISSKWFGGPWDDPRQHLSIGKVFRMLLFDVGKGPELISVDLRQLFFGQQKFQRPNPLFFTFGQDLLDGISAVSDLDLKLRE